MRRALLGGLSLLLVFGAAGCGSRKHEAVIKEMLEQLNALADTLESVKDRASAKAAAARINQICDRMEELRKRAESLPKPSKAEEERLKKKYDPELERIKKRTAVAGFQAGLKCGGEPDFIRAAQRLRSFGKKFGKK